VRHSRLADGCVDALDHDCPYLLAAVGGRNYRRATPRGRAPASAVHSAVRSAGAARRVLGLRRGGAERVPPGRFFLATLALIVANVALGLGPALEQLYLQRCWGRVSGPYTLAGAAYCNATGHRAKAVVFAAGAPPPAGTYLYSDTV
jgi:hypothetical protein